MFSSQRLLCAFNDRWRQIFGLCVQRVISFPKASLHPPARPEVKGKENDAAMHLRHWFWFVLQGGIYPDTKDFEAFVAQIWSSQWCAIQYVIWYSLSRQSWNVRLKKKTALLCVNPASEGKLCLAHACMSIESWGLCIGVVLNLSGRVGRRAAQEAAKSICELFWTRHSSRNRPRSRFDWWGKVIQTNCWTD